MSRLTIPLKYRQSLEVSDKEFVAADGEVGPGGGIADVALAEEVELFGGGVDEEEVPLFVEGQDLFALSDQAPILAERLSRPALLACGEIDAGEALVSEVCVDVAVDDDWSRHVTLSFVLPAFGERHLLISRGRIAALGEIEQP